MVLYHYFEKSKGPFLSISDLAHNEALEKLAEIQKININLVNPQKEWFLAKRHELESKVRDLFIKTGGKPQREHPFYMTVGAIDSMGTWYQEPGFIKIAIDEFALDTVSFTYGDMFPIFNTELNDGKEYRNTVYTYDEITEIIKIYGYPENIEYNLREGMYPSGAPMNHFLKYVEAHIWADDIPQKYCELWKQQTAGRQLK
jgi:hypothetical protein